MTRIDKPNGDDEPRDRRFSPRRSLPTGRAVVGALLVTIAAIGAFALATTSDSQPMTEYLVLRAEVEPGDSIDLDMVTFAALELSPDLAANALLSTAGLEGATALAHLHAGSLVDVRDLNGAAFVDGDPITSVHELTFPVPRDRAPAVLRLGDRVTMLAYSAADDILRTALEDALVLAYNTDQAGISSSDEGRLTLAIANADQVASTALLSYDSLTVVLTSRAIGDDYPDHVDRDGTAGPNGEDPA